MPDVGAPPLLEANIAEKLRIREGSQIAVIRELRFTVPRHEVTCLLGPSGCGKTTALRILMGLDLEYQGHVTPAASALRIGVVFQEPRLLPWRTVEENVRLVAPMIGESALTSLLSELGLAEWRRSRPTQLSLGMSRRVALARALAVDPDLLILDEAFVSLDERGAEALRATVFEAVERRKATVLMVTHNIREALQLSDTILVLAPRPTKVLDVVPLKQPRKDRDVGWLAGQRRRLAAATTSFLDPE